MSKRIIPTIVEVTCDCCGSMCGSGLGQAKRIQDGYLELNYSALDHLNMPVASGNVSLDLCDKCLHAMADAINEQQRILKTRAEEKKGALAVGVSAV